MNKKRLNNLTDLLSAIDTNDTSYPDRLSDPQRDELYKSIWLLMRYASDVSGDYKASVVDILESLLLTQILVNDDFMAISDHPDLQWKLLSHCGGGKKKFHSLLPPVGNKKVDKKIKMLSEVYPETKMDDLILLTQIQSEAKLKDLCEDYGFDKKEINTAFKR